MKKGTIYFTFLLFIALMSGCTKTEPDTSYCHNNIKDNGETEVDCGGPCTACLPTQIVTANIDGVPFNGASFSSQLSGQDGHKVMIVAATNQGVTFTITFSNPATDASRTLNSATMQSNDYYLLEPGDTGSVTITNLDTTRKIASGTFSFQATRGGGNDKTHLNDGVFKDIRYITNN